MMKHKMFKLFGTVVAAGAALLVVVAYLMLQACDDEPQTNPEVCNNSVDDDGDDYG